MAAVVEHSTTGATGPALASLAKQAGMELHEVRKLAEEGNLAVAARGAQCRRDQRTSGRQALQGWPARPSSS